MDLVQEWVPSEAEVPEDHWSKSPEYLAEKAATAHPGQGFVVKSNVTKDLRTTPTHDLMKSHFQVEWKPAEESEDTLTDRLKQREMEIRADVDSQSEVFEALAADMLARVTAALEPKDA